MFRISIIVGVAGILISSAGWTATTGFSVGNDFKLASLQGQITVTCDDVTEGRDHASYNCSGAVLDPAEFVYFVTKPGGSADQVRLTAFHQDGSRRTKEVGFNPETGRSTSRINLWIRTLFQRPLLEMGENRIVYEMLRNGQVVHSGEFQSPVTRGERRTCARRHMYSHQIQDCRTGNRICGDYFYQENWCE